MVNRLHGLMPVYWPTSTGLGEQEFSRALAQQPGLQQALGVEGLDPEALPMLQALVSNFLCSTAGVCQFDPKMDGVTNRQLNSLANIQQMRQTGDVLPDDQPMTPEEIDRNLRATYGEGAAEANRQIEEAKLRTQLGLFLALNNPNLSLEDLRQLLGPELAHLAPTIMELAQALSQTPPDNARIQELLAELDRLFSEALAGRDTSGTTSRLLRDQHGVGGGGGYGSPGGRSYGGGTAGPVVSQHPGGTAATDVPPGQFTAGTPGNPTETGLAALKAAKSQLGVAEATGNNDGVPAQRYSRGARVPWCANFVSWAFEQAGNVDVLGGRQASCSAMANNMKRAGRFRGRGHTPKAGDVIFFNTGRGAFRHVGIVDRVENGRVYTVEGNSGDKVSQRSYELGSSRIAGYGAT